MNPANSQDRIGFDSPLFRDFADLDSRRKELQLFFSDRGGETWKTRYKEWESHLHEYFALKNPTGEGLWKTERIDKLNESLTILDQKIGMALAFNALLLTGATIFLAWIPVVVEQFKCAITERFSDLLYTLTFATLFTLLAGLLVLLLGYRRVVWGDLGRSKLEGSEKERQYAGFLIMAVARRTNQFRISTYITALALGLLILLTLVGALFMGYGHRCKAPSDAGTKATSTSRLPNRMSVQNNSGIVQFGGGDASLKAGNNPEEQSTATGAISGCAATRRGSGATTKPRRCGCSSKTAAAKP